MNVKLNIPVYVIDSGCNIVDIETLYSCDGLPNDTYGHGTSMISIIQSCTKSKIYSVKIPNKPNRFDVISALTFINNNCIPGILSINWIISYDTLIADLLKKLYDKSFIIVCSAGHNNKVIDEVFPACLDYVINVGSINKLGNITKSCNKPSAKRKIDFYCNGTNILALNKNLEKIYISGTSVSSAFVSGILSRKFFRNRHYNKIQRHLKFIENKYKCK